MKVAILFSGGKDSTYAIHKAKEEGWDIRYLLSVKPTRKDCFLFHFATVEHTPFLAQQLDIRHILTGCDVADPKLEADIVKKIVVEQQKEDPVDAVILGGTGLQETQLRSIKEALAPENIDVFAAHQGRDHEELVKEMLDNGYTFVIAQVASDGLLQMLGRKIDEESFVELKKLADKFGFHIGAEGGPWDSFILGGAIFPKEFEIAEAEKVIDDQYCGHVVIKKLNIVEKPIVIDTADA